MNIILPYLVIEEPSPFMSFLRAFQENVGTIVRDENIFVRRNNLRMTLYDEYAMELVCFGMVNIFKAH